MQKLEPRKWQGTIIRILSEKGDQALIIDCIHRKMPVWMNISELDASTECSEEELFSDADMLTSWHTAFLQGFLHVLAIWHIALLLKIYSKIPSQSPPLNLSIGLHLQHKRGY